LKRNFDIFFCFFESLDLSLFYAVCSHKLHTQRAHVLRGSETESQQRVHEMVGLLRNLKYLSRQSAAISAGCVIALGSQGISGAQAKTMGFAVTSWLTAAYETADGKEECPQGFAEENASIYMKTLSPEKRKEYTKDNTLDISVDALARKVAVERGPNGEDVCWNPTVVKDPPMRTVKGTKGVGLNLDGLGSGKTTPNTCPHKNFTSVDGKNTGIDNQWYRLVGCTLGWRAGSDGYMEKNAVGELRDNGHALLFEISNVDDARNDSDVTVNIYQAVESLVKDATGSGDILPGASYHTVDGMHFATKGRITNGVLTTDPIDFKFSFTGNTVQGSYFIRDMRVQWDLSEDGRRATGVVAGYYDFDSLWQYMAKNGYLSSLGHFSCPAMYAAAKEFADGHRDPKTGECTALSSAFSIQAVSAYIVHEKQSAGSRGSIISQAEH
jgi:hypothetical protein